MHKSKKPYTLIITSKRSGEVFATVTRATKQACLDYAKAAFLAKDFTRTWEK